jgi:hypothetical protein
MNTCSRCKKEHTDTLKTCFNCRVHCRAYKKENKAACAIVLKLWKQKNWARRMVCHAMDNDRKRDRLPADMTLFVTPNYLQRLREHQENECAYCGIEMQTLNRKLHDGLTIQRLDNEKGHELANSILACFSCNCHRVERCNEAFLEEKRRTVCFDKLVRSGYQILTQRKSTLVQ